MKPHLPAYGRIPVALLYDRSFSALAVRLFAILDDCCNGSRYGEGCWPSMETLAAWLGVSSRTVRRHLRELEEAGWITTESRYREDGSQSSSRYHPQWSHEGRNDETGGADTEPRRGGHQRPPFPIEPDQENQTNGRAHPRRGEPVPGDTEIAQMVEASQGPEAVPAALEWASYRRESRLRAWKARTWSKALKEHPSPERLRAAVEHSIANGYQGLFEPTNGHARGERPSLLEQELARQAAENGRCER